MKKKLISIFQWLIPIALAVGGVFLYQNIPTSFLGLVCFALAGLFSLYFLIGILGNWEPMTAKVLRSLLSTLVILGLVVVGITGGFVLRQAQGQSWESCQYIVVLGAKVNGTAPSQILRQRIDAAEAYLRNHPDAKAVLSGGQGPDEGISEAQCMFNELTARGIAPERLLKEEVSTSTRENLKYSMSIIWKDTVLLPEKVGIVSSEFHLCRAEMFLSQSGVDPIGIPAHTENPVHFVNYFLREIAGVWHHIILGGS